MFRNLSVWDWNTCIRLGLLASSMGKDFGLTFSKKADVFLKVKKEERCEKVSFSTQSQNMFLFKYLIFS